MSTLELTEEMEVTRKWAVPAWLKVGVYIGLGSLVYQGGMLTYQEAKKALVKFKYSYVADVVSDELNGKQVYLDNKTNKRQLVSDMTPAQLQMAVYATTLRLESCEATLQTINNMSLNIEVIK